MKRFSSLTGRQKILIVLAIFVLMFLVFVVIYNLSSHKQASTDESTTYYDSNSGDTIVDPKNKTKESSTGRPDDPIYLGFSNLITNYSMTSYQLDALKQALYQNTSFRNKAISITIKEVTSKVDTSTNYMIYTMPIIVSTIELKQPQKYIMTVTATSLTSVIVKINDASGKKVFESAADSLPAD